MVSNGSRKSTCTQRSRGPIAVYIWLGTTDFTYKDQYQIIRLKRPQDVNTAVEKNINRYNNLSNIARQHDITFISLCNLDPFEPHFYIVILEFAGVYIISSFYAFLTYLNETVY